VRAARIHELGAEPRVDEIADPEPADGREPVEVLAAALNPLDINIAAGRFYGGHPPLPYVPGSEGVVRRGETRFHAFGDGLGIARDGTLAERAAVSEGTLVEVPDGIEDALAVAFGIAGVIAWSAVAWRVKVGPGDRVLVLGATGAVGTVALQAARLLGAERVVAAGRDTERLARVAQLGADETVELDGGEDLAERLRTAAGGEGPNVIVDPLWGDAAATASEAAAPGARIVHLGQSAGPIASFASAAVRGKELSILGVSNFARSRDERRALYHELLEHVRSGEIRLDVETFPLEQVDEAWRRQAAGAKVVVTVQR
jgi:NADPH:quinone reductase-like Zn-dependent oxidoreductase